MPPANDPLPPQSAARGPYSELSAGRELDKAVSVALGGKLNYVPGGDKPTLYEKIDLPDGSTVHRPLPAYSTDLAAAWLVFEALGFVVLQRSPYPDGSRFGYRCSIPEPNNPAKRGQPMKAINGDADTAPLAICRAALQACQHQPPPLK